MFLRIHESTHQKETARWWRVRGKEGGGLPGAPWGLGSPGQHHEWVGLGNSILRVSKWGGGGWTWQSLWHHISQLETFSVIPIPLDRDCPPSLALHAVMLLNFPLPPVSEYHPNDHNWARLWDLESSFVSVTVGCTSLYQSYFATVQEVRVR